MKNQAIDVGAKAVEGFVKAISKKMKSENQDSALGNGVQEKVNGKANYKRHFHF